MSNGTLKVRIDGYEFEATPVEVPESQLEVVDKWQLKPDRVLPPNHPASGNMTLEKWGSNYTFYEGQNVYGIGKQSVKVEFLN